jgi:hypothetical protein
MMHASYFEFESELVMPLLNQSSVDETTFDVSIKSMTLLNTANEHVHLNMLTKQVLIAE